MLRKSRKHLTTRFLQRTVLFSTSFSAGLALFFVFGNIQGFLDSTQSLILTVLSGSALITVILAFILILLNVSLKIMKKQRRLDIPMLILVFGCLIGGTVFSVIARFIILIAAGF